MAPKPTEADVQAFVADIVGDREDAVAALLDRLRQRGLPVEMLYLDLLAPAARLLGEMWSDDECDFATVTVALGRLQCLLRELSPAFGTEVAHPPNGRRALFAQPRDEQHSFGLSMVAEFFRRDGWEVVGGVGGAVDDPGARTAANCGWSGCALESAPCANRRAIVRSSSCAADPSSRCTRNG